MPVQSLIDKEKTVPKRGPSPWIKKTTRPASGFLHIIIRWNRLIPADYFCFLQLFREVYFALSNLTQILTHTGIFPDWRGL